MQVAGGPARAGTVDPSRVEAAARQGRLHGPWPPRPPRAARSLPLLTCRSRLAQEGTADSSIVINSNSNINAPIPGTRIKVVGASNASFRGMQTHVVVVVVVVVVAAAAAAALLAVKGPWAAVSSALPTCSTGRWTP